MKSSFNIVERDIKELTLEGGLGNHEPPCDFGIELKEVDNVEVDELRTSDCNEEVESKFIEEFRDFNEVEELFASGVAFNAICGGIETETGIMDPLLPIAEGKIGVIENWIGMGCCWRDAGGGDIDLDAVLDFLFFLGVGFVCILKCLVSSSDLENFLVQVPKVQWWGLSPV